MTFKGDTICPTCGQALPHEQVQEARDAHNESQALMLENNQNTGKKLVAQHVELKKKLAGLNEKMDQAKKEELLIREKLNEKRCALENLKAVKFAPDPEQIKEVEEIEAQLQDKESSLPGEKIAELERQIDEKHEDIDRFKGMILDHKANDRVTARLVELDADQKKISQQLSKVENDIFLIDEYTRAQMAMIEGRLNGLFDFAEFKLFQEQINGGINPTCETKYNGVPYGNLNSAARIQVGMDIINTLQGKYKTLAPVFVDNRESIVDLPDMESQTISLVVDGSCGTLAVNLIEEGKAA